jgi:hypothetical protein
MISINALAVIAYLLTAGYLLRTYREHLVLFGYFSFMSAWALISCFYNDLGIYNYELSRFTETTYGTARLAGFYIVFNLGFLFMARLLARHPLARVDYHFSRETLRLGHIKLSIYAAIFLIAAYLIYTLATEGIPIFSGVNRLQYFEQAGALERRLIIYVSPIAFLLGYFRRRRGRLSVNGLIIAAFILFAILVGNKFSLLVTMLISYFTPVSIRYVNEHRGRPLFTRRRLSALAGAVLFFILLSFVAYFHVLNDASQAYHLLVNRIFAFQGQMWWAVDHDISAHGRYDSEHWLVEMDNVLAPRQTPEGQVGMKYLMVKVLGPERAFGIFSRGYLFTHTYPAILIATFPAGVAIFIQFLAGMIFLMILYYLYYSVIYRHAVRALITILVVIPYLGMIFSGNFATFMTLGMLVKIAVLILIELGAPPQARPAPAGA